MYKKETEWHFYFFSFMLHIYSNRTKSQWYIFVPLTFRVVHESGTYSYCHLFRSNSSECEGANMLIFLLWKGPKQVTHNGTRHSWHKWYVRACYVLQEHHLHRLLLAHRWGWCCWPTSLISSRTPVIFRPFGFRFFLPLWLFPDWFLLRVVPSISWRSRERRNLRYVVSFREWYCSKTFTAAASSR